LSIADLPPPGAKKRWGARRKAEIVTAVRGGLLSLEEARNRYMLTVDEFLFWQYSVDRHGLAGLRSTRTQNYRQLASLERNPLSLAILSLIQLAPTPRLMVRPPESLAVTCAALVMVRYLVLLTCKIAGENRSRPRHHATSV
jgi:hypothetical protein